MAIPEEAGSKGFRPAWLGYIGVEDVNKYVELVKQAGGSLMRPAEDIPKIGRFAVVADHRTARSLYFFQRIWRTPRKSDSLPTPWDISVGMSSMLGISKQTLLFIPNSSDGRKGTRWIWARWASTKSSPLGELPDGGMMTKPPEMPKTAWLFYFNVEKADEAIDRIKQNGGKVVHGPQEVPGRGVG